MPDDEELLVRVQDGSHSAFAQLVERHNDKFYRLSYRYLGEKDDAEDMVQNAFLKLWENPYIFKNGQGAKFTTWFYRIVVNMCLDKKKKHSSLPLSEGFQVKDDRENAEDDLLKNNQQKLLKKYIGELPKRQKTALILCVYEDLSHKQAAEIMKLGEKALQSLLMRAKTNLKDKMRKYL